MFVYEKHHSQDELIYPIHAFDLNYHVHLHKSFEFVYCVRGELTAVIDGRGYTLHPNDMILIPSTVLHSYKTETASELYALLFGRNVIRSFSALFNQHVPAKYVFQADSILCGMLLEYFSATASDYAGRALLYRACDAFLDGNSFVEKEHEADDIAVKMIEYIQENFREELTLHDFARYIDYNYYYVSKLIKRNFDVSFTQLLSEYRVAHVKMLLEDGNCRITDAALASGFSSIRNFNRVFMEIAGVTPREYLASVNH